MALDQATLDAQMRLLMQGAEYGDEQLKQAMADELRGRLLDADREGRPLRVYCGYDPTSTDLHLGHTVTMRKLRQFQELGHQAIFVIGTFTALVGDPSDKDAARPRLSKEAVMANAQTYAEQAFKILEPEKTEVRYNNEWLSRVTLEEFINRAGLFTVQQFLVRDNFSKRFDRGDPIWVHELFYTVLQGIDAYTLEADVQLGGTEQLFNLLAGRKMQEALGQRPLVALTMPILVGTDGHMRMSKSTGNYIGISEPPSEMYGKVMSIPDSAMGNFFRLVTRWTPDEIEKMEEDLASGALHPRDAKMRLAREIVSIFHGEAEAGRAEAAFKRVFQEREAPQEMPAYRLEGPKKVLDIMVDAGLVSSRSEGRRLVRQRGVRLEGEVVSDAQALIDVQAPQVLRVGKRKFLRLIP